MVDGAWRRARVRAESAVNCGLLHIDDGDLTGRQVAAEQDRLLSKAEIDVGELVRWLGLAHAEQKVADLLAVGVKQPVRGPLGGDH